MNKHYDKYLCRGTPREFCKIYTDTFGRKYVYLDGNKYFIWELDNYKGLEVYNLTPAEQVECSEPLITKVAKWYLVVIVLGIFLGAILKMCIK